MSFIHDGRTTSHVGRLSAHPDVSDAHPQGPPLPAASPDRFNCGTPRCPGDHSPPASADRSTSPRAVPKDGRGVLLPLVPQDVATIQWIHHARIGESRVLWVLLIREEVGREGLANVLRRKAPATMYRSADPSPSLHSASSPFHPHLLLSCQQWFECWGVILRPRTTL